MTHSSPVPKTNSLATVSLVCSILGILCLLPIIGSIAAIITGHLARGAIKKEPTQAGRKLALVGLLLGYVGVIAWTLILFVLLIPVLLVGTLGSDIRFTSQEIERLSHPNSEKPPEKSSPPSTAPGTIAKPNDQENLPENLRKEAQDAMKSMAPNPGDFGNIIHIYLKPFTQDSPLDLEPFPGSDSSSPEKTWLEGEQLALEQGDVVTLYDIDKVSPMLQARIINSLISGDHINDPNDLMKASKFLASLLLNRATSHDSTEKSE